MMKFNIYISLFLMLFASSVIAQAPKYSNEFLSLGIAARGLAMSNSVVASTNDVTSGYWNTPGILEIEEDLQIGLMHSEYFAGIAKYDYIGLAKKLNDNSAIGISLIRFGVDDIPNTLDMIDKDGNILLEKITSFSVVDYAFLLSYAQKTKIEGLNVGGNAKIIRRIVGEFASSWGFGLDVGAKYIKNNWIFGANFRDVTSTFNAWTFNTSAFEDVFIATGNEIPQNSLEITTPKILLGAARKFNVYKKIKALVEIDADITTDGKRNVMLKSDLLSFDPHLGAEFYYNDLIFFRLGVGNFQKIPNIDGSKNFTFQPNMGLGIKFKHFAVDYAFTDIGDQSIALYSHVFSIRYGINKKAEAKSLQ